MLAKAAFAVLRHDQPLSDKLQFDGAAIVRFVRFEDCGIAFDLGNAARFAEIGNRPAGRVVFVEAVEFHAQSLFSKRPDTNNSALAAPSTIHLRGRNDGALERWRKCNEKGQ